MSTTENLIQRATATTPLALAPLNKKISQIFNKNISYLKAMWDLSLQITWKDYQ